MHPEITAKAPHLTNWPLAAWMTEALAEYGQSEISGGKSNPRILEYRKMAGIALGGDDGAVPWCAIYINAMLAQAQVKGSGSAMARSFVSSPYFQRLGTPMVGCITVISSNRGPASGHVFFYAAENGLFFQALGGNQDDAVNLSMFHKAKLVGHYWPKGVPRPPKPFDQPVKIARVAATKPVRDA